VIGLLCCVGRRERSGTRETGYVAELSSFVIV
jgi:hypothetical protein